MSCWRAARFRSRLLNLLSRRGVQAAKVHAALSGNSGAAATAAAQQQDTRSGQEMLSALARALHVTQLLEREFDLGGDAEGPGWEALLALGGGVGVREWGVLRLKYDELGKAAPADFPVCYHTVPLEVCYITNRSSCISQRVLHSSPNFCPLQQKSELYMPDMTARSSAAIDPLLRSCMPA